MNEDFDEAALEDALRGDLPTAETERRLRSRLLAAGIAVGNGVAATTAAAGQAAAGVGTGATTSGVVAKVLGLSWGIKLGAAAAVAIPTIGLWLERSDTAPARSSTATLAPPPRSTSTSAATVPAVAPRHDETAAALSAAPAPERAISRAARPASIEPPPAAIVAAKTAHPSQSSFAELEPVAREPGVATTLADETRLLDGAFVAIAAGQRERAAQLIAEHESRYPSGLLKQERERAKLKLSELSRGE